LKVVPPRRSDRERIRAEALARAARLDRSRPLSRQAIERCARSILADLGLAEGYCGWAMVAVATAFWRAQVEAIPPSRRLLLLPHCLRSSQTCPAEYNEAGLLCQDCGACELCELRAAARRRGYQVLIAEGSPAVIDLILQGTADAILGAACLNSLEKVFDKILVAGIPCMAIPLLKSTCRDTSIDVDWVREMIDTPYVGGDVPVRTYVHLLRAAARLFEPEELERLLPRRRSGAPAPGGNGQAHVGRDPVAATETIAHDFLRRGGKHLRPFITLAAYDAMTDCRASGRNGDSAAAEFPDAVKRIALAMEVFHKASLVHDDIEDDDPYRYGLPAVHREHGAATAINVGDYLIGLGYRLVAGERTSLSCDVVAEVLGRLAEAHTKLCEGQGAELAWREASDKRIAAAEALTIYALKTAPAFEAALYAGMRLAEPAAAMAEPGTNLRLVPRFARHLGVAFQVLNDLEDWRRGQPNKRSTGTDVLGGRPTVLWAFALESLPPAEHQRLERLVCGPPGDPDATLEEVRGLYDRAGVFEKASALVSKHRQRAHEVAQSVPHVALARLFHYLADTILQ
jgi:geranylgeranyl pyrophosphate synthase